MKDEHCNHRHSEWHGALHAEGYRVMRYLHRFEADGDRRKRYSAITQKELNRQNRVGSYGLHDA